MGHRQGGARLHSNSLGNLGGIEILGIMGAVISHETVLIGTLGDQHTRHMETDKRSQSSVGWKVLSLFLFSTCLFLLFLLWQKGTCSAPDEATTAGAWHHDFVHDANLWNVISLTLLSLFTSGLGGVPFFFFRNLSPRWICFYNSIAAGMMLAASLSLAHESLYYSTTHTLLGLLVGILFVGMLPSRLASDPSCA